MDTPEGTVKKAVDVLLKQFKVYQHKPVQNGMGKPALDYHVCHRGLYAAIETKATGKTFSDRQARTCKEVMNAGGSLFLVDAVDGAGMDDLTQWLRNPRAGHIGFQAAVHLSKYYQKTENTHEE